MKKAQTLWFPYDRMWNYILKENIAATNSFKKRKKKQISFEKKKKTIHYQIRTIENSWWMNRLPREADRANEILIWIKKLMFPNEEKI